MIVRELKSHSGSVNSVRFTKDGNYCLTASSDRTICLWNPHKEETTKCALKIKTYSGQHGHEILDIAIAEDNTKFASCGGDRSAFLWDVATGNTIRRIQGHTSKINAVKLNSDGTVLLTASYDKTVACWDLRSNLRDPIQTMSDFRDSVTCLGLSTYSILAGSVDGTLHNYDMRKGLRSIYHLSEPITSFALTSDQKCAATMCLGEDSIHLIDLTTSVVLKQYIGHHTHRSFKSEVVLSKENDRLFCGSEDSSVVCYNFLTGNFMSRISLPSSQPPTNNSTRSSPIGSRAVSSLAIHPTMPILLSAQYDSSVRYIDLGV